MTDSIDPADEAAALERRSRLLGVKLMALVSAHLGRDVVGEAAEFPGGAAVVDGETAWVLIDGEVSRALGGALAWAVRQSATSLNLIGETGTGVLARRSQQFTFPTSVWFPDERQLLAAIAAPFPEAPLPAPEHLALRDVIEAAGATATIEHGVVFGEVRGLEVCRVVDQPTVGLFSELGDVSSGSAETLLDAAGTAGLASREYEGVQLEVGVGVNDREAFRLLHGDIPTVEALRGVVETVEAHRTIEAQQHPLNRLAQERFLRWRLEQEPALIGASEVTAAEPPVARPNLKDSVPCVATAVVEGRPTMLVFSNGVDLDLIPFVADVQALHDDPVIIVAPKRDLVPITSDLSSLLKSPVELRSIN